MRQFLFLSLIILSTNLFGQNNGHVMQQLQVDVVYLASDYLEGRETGLQGEILAGEYIAWRFEQLGLAPKGQDGTWYHEFDFTYKSNPHAEGGEPRTGRNVLGYLDNNAENTIVIGGHYDHLGYGDFSSLHAGEPAIHNGADDNASGIAAMLYMAEYLKNSSSAKNNNYLFLAFSGEELGLVGSKRWVADPTMDLEQINYMVNMDMVGMLNEEKILAVNGVGTSPLFPEVVEAIDVAGIQAKTSESGTGPSDHTSFYLQKIPVLHFFTGQHSHYHKPSDDVPLLNFDGLLGVSNFILAIIEQLDDDGRLEYVETKNEGDGREAAAFKVTLGVMPDYVYGGTGMRVDSVIEGRTGQKGGMKNGDVIIKIGDVEVGDIYDYMEGLSKFKTGETATVTVKRGEEEVDLEVTF